MSGLPSPADDETLILKILDGDKEGLAVVVELYYSSVYGYLRTRFGSVCDADLHAAMNAALYRVWRYAGSFDPGKGSLRSWLATIARNQVQNILLAQKDHPVVPLQAGLAMVDDCADDVSDGGTLRRFKDVEFAIENKLSPLQRAILKADYEAGGEADTAMLAQRHGTNRNTISSSRSQGRARVRQYVLEEERRRSNGGRR